MEETTKKSTHVTLHCSDCKFWNVEHTMCANKEVADRHNYEWDDEFGGILFLSDWGCRCWGTDYKEK